MFESKRNRENGFETVEPNKSKKAGKVLGGFFGTIALLIVAAVVIFGSTYQIKEQEQAVLITFGQAKAVTEPGLHFKIPLIQQVKKVNTTIQGFAIGYSEDGNVSNEESLMITSDYNFVNVDFFVEYRYADPVKHYTHRRIPQVS